MLLQALYDYALSRHLLKDPAFSEKAVRWIIDLDAQGNLIGSGPIDTSDEKTNKLKERVKAVVSAINPDYTIHDFRIVSGKTHTNLIFDVTVPFECPMSDNAVKAAVAGQVSRLDETFCTVLTVDRV